MEGQVHILWSRGVVILCSGSETLVWVFKKLVEDLFMFNCSLLLGMLYKLLRTTKVEHLSTMPERVFVRAER